MPNWKKVITSGSDAALNSLELTNELVLTGSLQHTGSHNLDGTMIISGSNPGEAPEALQVYGDIKTFGYHRFDPVTTNINTSISASYIYVSGSTNDLYFSQNGDGYNNVTRLRWLEGNLNTGILWGGIVSGSVGGTTIDISEGEGIVTSLNAFTGSEGPNPVINKVSWNDYNDVSLTYLTSAPTTWLLINNSGAIVQQTTAPTAEQLETLIQIGVVIHPNQSTISLVRSFTQTSYGSTRQIFQFIRIFGGLKVSGHIIRDNGSNLQLSRTSGVAFALGRNYSFDPDEPSLMDDSSATAPNIFYYYKESGDWVTTTGTNVINPNQYNEDGDGLSTVNNNKWTIQRIFFFPKSPNDIGVYYGRQQYSTLADAQNNLQFEDFDEIDNTQQQAIFLGYLIVEKGATALDNTNTARFLQAGAFRTTGTGGGGGAPVVTNLGDLNDVAIASVESGDLISWNGAEWQNTKSGINITGSLLGTATTALTSSYVDFNSIDNIPSLISSSLQFNDLSSPFTGSFTGSFTGDGSGLTGITVDTASLALNVDFDNIDNKPTLVSGSSQISFNGITDKPTLISSSLQFNTFDTPFTGSFTGSFNGDGSGITNIAEAASISASFSSTGSITINHSLNSKNLSVDVYDDSDILIIPDQVTLLDNNTVKVDFAGSTSGFVSITRGGHLILTNDIAGFNKVLDQTSSATTWSFNHNLGNQYPQLSVYDSSDELIIPGKVEAVDLNNLNIYFDTPQSGVATATVGGTATTASYADSFTIKNINLSAQENLDVDTGTETIAQVSTTQFDGAFFDYVLKDGTNYRAGTIMSVWDGSSIEFTDNSTADIGDTSSVSMSMDISSSFARLLSTVSSDNWNIKTLVRAL